MKPKNKAIMGIVKDYAEAACKMFFEEGHEIEDYDYCEKVIEFSMNYFNIVRRYQENKDNDTQ